LISQILVIASGQKPYLSMMRKERNDNNNNNNQDGDGNDGMDNDEEEGEDDDDDENICKDPILCLDEWSREHWETLHNELVQLRHVLLRDDATINYSSTNDTLGFPPRVAAAAAAASRPAADGNDDDSSDDDDNNNSNSNTVDEKADHCKLVAFSRDLGKEFKRLELIIEINKAVAPIREELERQIREPIKESENNNNDVVVVDTKQLIEIL
jgi:hypothetical protein